MISSISIASAVNNEDILKSCLARSPDISSGHVQLSTHQGYSSAGCALNAGIDASNSAVIVLAHQDVYLPRGWIDELCRQIDALNRNEPKWAVLGVIGIRVTGEVVGRVWSTGLRRVVGKRIAAPTEVVSIDECLIVLRRSSGLRFDPHLPNWHLYATDIILEARKRGYSAFVVDAPVIHNSRATQTLRGGYTAAYAYMKRKWKACLPVPTLVAPLTRNPWQLFRAQWRRLKANWGRRRVPTIGFIDPAALAQNLGWDR